MCLCVCFIVSMISQIKLKKYMYVGELPMFGISVNRSTSNIPSDKCMSLGCSLHETSCYMYMPSSIVPPTVMGYCKGIVGFRLLLVCHVYC